MNQLLQKMFNSTAKLLSVAAGGATLHIFVTSLKDNELQGKYIAQVERTKSLQDQLSGLLDSSIKDSKILNQIGGLHAEWIDVKKGADLDLELLKAAHNLPQNTDLAANLANSQAKHHIGNFSNNISKLNDLSSNIVELIKKYNGSGGGVGNSSSSNFTDLLLETWHQYQDLLSTLSTQQLGALGHLWMFIVILLCLFSIISVFYGDWLIRYFKIEEKLPKLARFIQLRRKFQHYYLILNFIIILIVLLIIISVNLYVLFL